MRFLTVVLGGLLLARFLIVPVIDWQNDTLFGLNLEKGQLQKMRNLLKSEAQLLDLAQAYDAELSALQEVLFNDTELLKLSVQAELMKTISAAELSVRSFSWVFDKDGPHRTLRAQVSYSGSFGDSIKMLWTLDASPRMFRVVDSRHMIKSQKKDSLGTVEGFLTLEVYAVGELGGYDGE